MIICCCENSTYSSFPEAAPKPFPLLPSPPLSSPPLPSLLLSSLDNRVPQSFTASPEGEEKTCAAGGGILTPYSPPRPRPAPHSVRGAAARCRGPVRSLKLLVEETAAFICSLCGEQALWLGSLHLIQGQLLIG